MIPANQTLDHHATTGVLHLHASGCRSESAVRGIARLQRLLFAIQHTPEIQATSHGPALEVAGFIHGADPSPAAPSFDQMMATVTDRAGSQPSQRGGHQHD